MNWAVFRYAAVAVYAACVVLLVVTEFLITPSARGAWAIQLLIGTAPPVAVLIGFIAGGFAGLLRPRHR